MIKKILKNLKNKSGKAKLIEKIWKNCSNNVDEMK